MGKILPVFLAINLFLLIVSNVSAHHRDVLGDSTSEIIFPPVTSGTGYILPDSPLFFVDQTFQQAKLLLAFTSDAKAKVRTQIMGERLAELRLMLSRGSELGVSTALDQLGREGALAAADLTDASAQGKNVTLLAQEINEILKVQRNLLKNASLQAKGSLAIKLKAATQVLREAKTEVEDQLPEDDLDKEVEEDLEDELESEFEEASASAAKIEAYLDKLDQQVLGVTTKALTRREQALKKAIVAKNEELRKKEQKLLDLEKNKRKRLLEAQQKVKIEARDGVNKAKEAILKLRSAREKVNLIKKEPVE